MMPATLAPTLLYHDLVQLYGESLTKASKMLTMVVLCAEARATKAGIKRVENLENRIVGRSWKGIWMTEWKKKRKPTVNFQGEDPFKGLAECWD